MSASMELPLPARLQCSLTIKAGKALERCRDKGIECRFDFYVHEGYEVLRAKVKAAMALREVAWNESIEIYLKHAKSVHQRAFIKLGVDDFTQTLTQAWHIARLRRGGQRDFALDLFVYINRPKATPNTTLNRTTESRVQQALHVYEKRWRLPTSNLVQHRYATQLPRMRDFQTIIRFKFQTAQHSDSSNTLILYKGSRTQLMLLTQIANMPRLVS